MGNKVKGVIHGAIIRWSTESITKHPKSDVRGIEKEFQFAWTPLYLSFGSFPTPSSVMVKVYGLHGRKTGVHVFSANVGGRGGFMQFNTRAAATKKYTTIKRALMQAKNDGAVVTIIRKYTVR